MKRVILISILLVLGFGFCRSPEDEKGGELIATESLTLRKEPAFASIVLATLSKGEKVVVLEKGGIGYQSGKEFHWYKVRNAKGEEGWLFGVNAKTPTQYFGNSERLWYLTKTIRLYNKHGYAEDAEESGDFVQLGTPLKELDRKREWVQVEQNSNYGLKEGWVHTLYLTTADHLARVEEEARPCFRLKKYWGLWIDKDRELYICYSSGAFDFRDTRDGFLGFNNLRGTDLAFTMEVHSFDDDDKPIPVIEARIKPVGPNKIRYTVHGEDFELIRNVPTRHIPEYLRYRWVGSNDKFSVLTLDLCSMTFMEESLKERIKISSVHLVPERTNSTGNKYEIIYIPELWYEFQYDPETDSIGLTHYVDSPVLHKESCK